MIWRMTSLVPAASRAMREMAYAGDGHFPHIAPAAEQLDALIDRPAEQFGRLQLGDGGVDRVELPPLMRLQAAVNEAAADGDAGMEIGELELGVLKVSDGMAEGLAPVV